jgi:hypothetical protein
MIDAPLHRFERAGLGPAPFRFVDVFKVVYQACPGAPIQPGGCCDYCGTAIFYQYVIRAADGKKFKVGSECVYHTDDEPLIKEVKKAKRVIDKQNATDRKTRKLESKREREAAEAASWRIEHTADLAILMLGESNPFVHDLLTKAQLRPLTDRQLETGLAAAHREVEFLKRREIEDARRAASGWIGTVGERIEVDWTTDRVIDIGTHQRWDYNCWRNIYLGHDAAGNTLKYIGGPSDTIPAKGETERIRGTVIAHDEYNGSKQTVIARPKSITKRTTDQSPINPQEVKS